MAGNTHCTKDRPRAANTCDLISPRSLRLATLCTLWPERAKDIEYLVSTLEQRILVVSPRGWHETLHELKAMVFRRIRFVTLRLLLELGRVP